MPITTICSASPMSNVRRPPIRSASTPMNGAVTTRIARFAARIAPMNGSESPTCCPTIGKIGNTMPPATPARSVPGASASASAVGECLPLDAFTCLAVYSRDRATRTGHAPSVLGSPGAWDANGRNGHSAASTNARGASARARPREARCALRRRFSRASDRGRVGRGRRGPDQRARVSAVRRRVSRRGASLGRRRRARCRRGVPAMWRGAHPVVSARQRGTELSGKL